MPVALLLIGLGAGLGVLGAVTEALWLTIPALVLAVIGGFFFFQDMVQHS